MLRFCARRVKIPTMSERTAKLIELVVLLVACLLPWYLLAGDVSRDELVKTAGSVATTGSVLAIHKAWKGKR